MGKINECNGTINLVGSKFRDKYRFLHKQYSTYESACLREKCPGLDIDFVEMRWKWNNSRPLEAQFQNSFFEIGEIVGDTKNVVEFWCKEWYIAAFTDIKKKEKDTVSPTEKWCYNILDLHMAPVIIIDADEEFEEFSVHRFNKERIVAFSASDFWNTFLPNIEDFIYRDLS